MVWRLEWQIRGGEGKACFLCPILHDLLWRGKKPCLKLGISLCHELRYFYMMNRLWNVEFEWIVAWNDYFVL